MVTRATFPSGRAQKEENPRIYERKHQKCVLIRPRSFPVKTTSFTLFPLQHFFTRCLALHVETHIRSVGLECEEDKLTVNSEGKQRCRAKVSEPFFSVAALSFRSQSTYFRFRWQSQAMKLPFLVTKSRKREGRGVMKNSRKFDQKEKVRGREQIALRFEQIYLSAFRSLASFDSYLKPLSRRFNDRLWRGVSCINQVEEQKISFLNAGA